jgi:uncharacterized protein YfiM (DUF2279 family)
MRRIEANRVMSRREFKRALAAQIKAVAMLVSQRNAAYAGGDALKCWRKRGLAGLLVRLEDKLARFETFIERGGGTELEWRELLTDVAGYALCGLVWLAHGTDASIRDGCDE